MQAERLKEIRNNLELSQSRFGAFLGIPQTTYANYESGKAAIPDQIKIKLLNMGYNINWLLTGEGPMYVDLPKKEKDENWVPPLVLDQAYDRKNNKIVERHWTPEDGEDFTPAPIPDDITFYIPMTNMKLSAGRGWDWESEEIYTGELLPVPMKIARRFDEKNLIAATVKGDSMEPTLHDGEPVAYVKEFENGDGIYALAILDEVYIKRLSIDKLKKEITIISDNPKYPAKTYPMDQEGLQVLGKVVFWIHVE